eukprot:TRINITY_DN51696_c0_g1_i1.p1 TRINITY_DN51696_c0_g1~~TRINITY_DN51696_c0_g1_i1.p1  ORF type:complete len:190 (+),score=44.87 TRINITY_DN51696_c0_g1_i1:66-635(+)
MGPSKTAKAKVKNAMGQHARRIQVAHIFHQSVGASFYHHHVWTDVHEDGCTGSDLHIEFEAGLGEWTDHDYWFVQVELEDGTVWSCCPPARRSQLTRPEKRPAYLAEEGTCGFVDITVSKGSEGLQILGLHSDQHCTDFLEVGKWISDPHVGWDTCPHWVRWTAEGAECTEGVKADEDASAIRASPAGA